ncbi:HypC/HybG/HupF family hydrogenase formation chaperone [Amphritea pacifica]|uniref:HypC/HybG/HupF family hydrogenase formation chaperone n=1 Tax=Amphritea pacifica TaxID=2811233 RepID=A0ABS2W2S9_9GAMM|nr:HypC/HybG/HupF family hydrogenase formation chaperone [Amphritea pacifica]MBN0986009.1 HypC/HybG/HupF family hydrogenase formation chaperone [Amphritea pacifica]MBN1006789.1 HypC/HybG/HupF family hydrogenase formation chaperone [Amphritea pacifica]
MCIGIPMQVLRCDGFVALCEAEGEQQTVDMSLVGELPPGSWVLVFLGAAREQITEQRARETADAISALHSVMRGEAVDMDSLFADLIQSEPQLPEHLQITTEEQ